LKEEKEVKVIKLSELGKVMKLVGFEDEVITQRRRLKSVR
jgi:hypothetical protein